MEMDQFGWDLLYELYKDYFISKRNVIVIFTHFVLIKSGFLCLGMGLQKPSCTYEHGTEILPNQRQLCITVPPTYIRYIYHRTVFVLHISDVNELGHIIIKLFRLHNYEMRNTIIPVEAVYCLRGNFDQIMPFWRYFMINIRNNLIRFFDHQLLHKMPRPIKARKDDGNNNDGTGRFIRRAAT